MIKLGNTKNWWDWRLGTSNTADRLNTPQLFRRAKSD
jgi:hypothetical protein